MVAELFTPAFIVVFFGVGAWAAALTAALWPGLDHELAAFLVVSVLSLFLLRRRLVATFQGRRTEARAAPAGDEPRKIGLREVCSFRVRVSSNSFGKVPDVGDGLSPAPG